MRPQFEQIHTPDAEASFRAVAFTEPRFDHPLHFHPVYELTLIVESRGRRFVGDHVAPFGPGDVCLLGPNLPHLYHNDPVPNPARGETARACVVQFREDCLGPGFWTRPELRAVGRLLARAGRGLEVADSAARAGVGAELSALVTRDGAGRVIGLLGVLDQLGQVDAAGGLRVLSGERYLPGLDAGRHDEARLGRVLRLLHARLGDPELSQPEAARAASLTPAAFSRFFRRRTGRSFAAFLNELRVSEACRRLVETEETTVAAICYACGFGNLSNFNRRFRVLKDTSPTDYRRRVRLAAARG